MRSHFFQVAGLALGTFALAGCGISPHVGGTPTSTSRSLRSATVQPSGGATTSAAPPSSFPTITPPDSISTTSPAVSKPHITDTSSLDTGIADVVHYQCPMPIELPTCIPSIESHPSWSVTATTRQTSHSYQVTFWRSAPALSINSAQFSHSSHVWITTIQGSHYGSTTQAYRALQTQAAPTWIPLTRLGTHSASVLLTSGITARLYPSGVLQWTVGTWTIQVSNGNRTADMMIANSLLAHINPASLPAPHGILAATATASGEQFQAAWANSSNVYDFTPFALQIRGSGVTYDRILSARSGTSLFIHQFSWCGNLGIQAEEETPLPPFVVWIKSVDARSIRVSFL